MADNTLPKVAETALPVAAMENVTHVRVVSTDNSEKLPINNLTIAGTKVTVAVDGLSGTVDGAFGDVLTAIAEKADTTQVEALDAEKVDKTQSVIAGAGMTGGGALAGDVTLNVITADDSLVVGADNVKVNTVDALTSDSATRPLSAKRGKELDAGKVNKTDIEQVRSQDTNKVPSSKLFDDELVQIETDLNEARNSNIFDANITPYEYSAGKFIYASDLITDCQFKPKLDNLASFRNADGTLKQWYVSRIAYWNNAGTPMCTVNFKLLADGNTYSFSAQSAFSLTDKYVIVKNETSSNSLSVYFKLLVKNVVAKGSNVDLTIEQGKISDTYIRLVDNLFRIETLNGPYDKIGSVLHTAITHKKGSLWVKHLISASDTPDANILNDKLYYSYTATKGVTTFSNFKNNDVPITFSSTCTSIIFITWDVTNKIWAIKKIADLDYVVPNMAISITEIEAIEDINTEMDVYNPSPSDSSAQYSKKIINENYSTSGIVRHIATGNQASDLSQLFFIKKIKPHLNGAYNINLLMSSKDNNGNKLTTGMPTPVMLDVNSSFSLLDTYNCNQIYAHPSVCYCPGGIAGYKYWMVNSNIISEEYEDEEVFVSNDGTTWKRVKGAYEDTDTDNLGFRLPPQLLVTDSYSSYKKKNVLLPIPIPTDNKTIEVLGNPYLIKTSMKNDPFILYDNGYVYMYINYHFASWENGIKNSPVNPYNKTYAFEHKFVICVRTNGTIDGDGMVWEVVRADGSTFRLTEASSLRLFTSDSGVNNFIRHQDLTPVSNGSVYVNPETELCQSVIKVSENLYYFYFVSGSFMARRAGTTPYSFDWNNKTACTTTGHKGHHPDVRYYNNKYYILGGGKLHESTDGVTFTMYPHRIGWAGSSNGRLYKESFVYNSDESIVLYVSARKGYVYAGRDGMDAIYQPTDRKLFDKTFIQRFVGSNLSDIINIATNGYNEGNIDVCIVKSASEANNTPVVIYEKIGLKPTEYIGNFGKIRLETDLNFSINDYLHIIITCNCRNGGVAEFGAIVINNS